MDDNIARQILAELKKQTVLLDDIKQGLVDVQMAVESA